MEFSIAVRNQLLSRIIFAAGRHRPIERSRAFLCRRYQLQTFAHCWRLHGQKIEAPRLDIRARSHVEGTCEKEKTSGNHRSDLEADRRRDTAKSIQHRIIARFASLKSRADLPWQAPATTSTQAPRAAGILTERDSGSWMGWYSPLGSRVLEGLVCIATRSNCAVVGNAKRGGFQSASAS